MGPSLGIPSGAPLGMLCSLVAVGLLWIGLVWWHT